MDCKHDVALGYSRQATKARNRDHALAGLWLEEFVVGQEFEHELRRTVIETDNVWFYDVANDGYSLDDKRNRIEEDDLPDCLAKWQAYRAGKTGGLEDKTAKAFLVAAEDIRANKYDLSINRYREVVYEEEQYDLPKEILGRLMALEEEIQQELKKLEGML